MEQIKSLDKGHYSIQSINSSEDFFSAIPTNERQYCFLEKLRDPSDGGDIFLRLTTIIEGNISLYYGFLNWNGSYRKFIKI